MFLLSSVFKKIDTTKHYRTNFITFKNAYHVNLLRVLLLFQIRKSYGMMNINFTKWAWKVKRLYIITYTIYKFSYQCITLYPLVQPDLTKSIELPTQSRILCHVQMTLTTFTPHQNFVLSYKSETFNNCNFLIRINIAWQSAVIVISLLCWCDHSKSVHVKSIIRSE